MKICVFGAASAHIDDNYIKEVEELGTKMAARGHSLVFGAGGTGLMGAAARGVKSGGGYVHEADAFIIAPGGVGTFEEFFEVLTLKQLGRHGKAIAIFNINGYYDDLEKFMRCVAERKFITYDTNAMCEYFTDADEILDYLENYKPANTPWRKLKTGD